MDDLSDDRSADGEREKTDEIESFSDAANDLGFCTNKDCANEKQELWEDRSRLIDDNKRLQNEVSSLETAIRILINEFKLNRDESKENNDKDKEDEFTLVKKRRINTKEKPDGETKTKKM